MLGDYYEDLRFCATCDAYVFYLLSPAAAYCSVCGAPVSLLSEGDLARLRQGAPKGPSRRIVPAYDEYQDAS